MAEQAPAPTERQKRIDARKAKIAAATPKVERVRVNPASDTFRDVLAHPSGIKFPEQGSVEWPLDSFTKRRLADGSVTREREQKPPQPAARPEAKEE